MAIGKVGRQIAFDEVLDRLRVNAFFEVNPNIVVLIATLAVFPGHRRVVLELIELGAHQRIAALDLVIEKREG